MNAEYIAWLIAISGFAIVMTFTPGPNNIMLATSGANYGLKRSAPHILGVAFGFPAMLIVVALGVVVLLENPMVSALLRVVGIAYIIYLAYLIGKTDTISKSATSQPLTFFQAAGFQWINPKAWAQAIGAVSAYVTVGEEKYLQIFAMALVFLPVGVASSYIWAAFGEQIAKLLNTRKKLRFFNVTMAVALVLTVMPVILFY